MRRRQRRFEIGDARVARRDASLERHHAVRAVARFLARRRELARQASNLGRHPTRETVTRRRGNVQSVEIVAVVVEDVRARVRRVEGIGIVHRKRRTIGSRQSAARGGRRGSGSSERRDALARRLDVGAEGIDDGVGDVVRRRRRHPRRGVGREGRVPSLEGRVEGCLLRRWREVTMLFVWMRVLWTPTRVGVESSGSG